MEVDVGARTASPHDGWILEEFAAMETALSSGRRSERIWLHFWDRMRNHFFIQFAASLQCPPL